MDAMNIASVLATIRAEKARPSSTNFQLCCPLARWTHPKGRDSDPSMGIQINPKGVSFVNCFACHWKGTLLGLIRELGRLDDMSDIDYATLEIDVAMHEEVDPSVAAAAVPKWEDTPRAGTRALFTSFPEVYLDGIKGLAHPYILRRGLRIEPTLKTWEVGYDREKRRVVFPLRDVRGRLVGAVGRSVIPSAKFPYVNYWSMEKAEHLHGEHLAASYGPVIVVEGPLKALYVWQALNDLGVNMGSVVSLMGTRFSERQVDTILSIASQVLLFFDNDPYGEKGVAASVKVLRGKLPVYKAAYPEGEEPGGDPDRRQDGSFRPASEVLEIIDRSQPA
jgi:hypothetical protein